MEELILKIELLIKRRNILIDNFIYRIALSQTFDCSVEFFISKNIFNTDKLLYQYASIRIYLKNDAIKYFHGKIGYVRRKYIDEKIEHFSIKIFPDIWFLKLETMYRTFQYKNVLEIVQQIILNKNYKIDISKIEHRYEHIPYCVQYEENTLDFIERILSFSGISYAFKHDINFHTLVLYDSFHNLDCSTHRVITIKNEEKIACSNKFMHKDYNYLNARSNLEIEQNNLQDQDNEFYLLQKYPGEYLNKSDGVRKTFLYEQSFFCKQKIFYDNSIEILYDICDFVVDKDSNKYIIIGIEHVIINKCYYNNFYCILKNTNYAPTFLAKKKIYSAQTATVISNDQHLDTNNNSALARIQIKFHWQNICNIDNAVQACWARIASNKNSSIASLHCMPEIGDEVIVIFENGDPERPIIIGSVCNSINQYDKLFLNNSIDFGLKTKNKSRISIGNKQRKQPELMLDIFGDVLNLTRGNQIFNVLKKCNFYIHDLCSFDGNNDITFKVGATILIINKTGVFVNGKMIS